MRTTNEFAEYLKFLLNPKRMLGYLMRVLTFKHVYTVINIKSKLYAIDSFISDPELYRLRKKINKLLKEQVKKWPAGYLTGKYCYQDFEEIKIAGYRSTHKRFYQYELNKYLRPEDTLLDIGANSCFLSCFIARYVKHVEALDINPYLIEMGRAAAEYLKLKNTNFIAEKFEDYNTQKKFSRILVCAAYETSDKNIGFTLDEYLTKVNGLLAKDGLLLFESHGRDCIDKDRYKNLKSKLSGYFDIIEEKELNFRHPTPRFELLKRVFFVCQKR